MIIHKWSDPGPWFTAEPVVALGFFDGFHLGHRLLLETAGKLGEELNAPVVLLTFDPHPSRVLPKTEAVGLIYGKRERARVLEEFSQIREELVIVFEETLRLLSPQDFVKQVLHERIHARAVVAGENFRFGRDQSGNARALSELCADQAMLCRCVPEVYSGGMRVSSTRIRSLLSEGSVEEAASLLGQAYQLCGTITHGFGIGHEKLLPTANILLEEGRVYPKDGVYLTLVQLEDGQVLEALTNIGTNPTLEKALSRRAETYLLDQDRDLYDQEIRILFLHYLRPEKHFSSLEELKRAQTADVRSAREYFEKSGKCPAFGNTLS